MRHYISHHTLNNILIISSGIFLRLTQVRWRAELWQSWCVNKTGLPSPAGGQRVLVTVWRCLIDTSPASTDWVLTEGGGWVARLSSAVPPADTGHGAHHRQSAVLTWRWLVIASPCWRRDKPTRQWDHVTLSDNTVIGPDWWAREDRSPPSSLQLNNVSREREPINNLIVW